MTDMNPENLGSDIDFMTLDVLANARATLLIDLGFDPQAARMFSLLELQMRQALAKSVGGDRALLARLVWLPDGEEAFACELVLDDAPADLHQ